MKTKNSEDSPIGESERRRGAWYGLAVGDALGARFGYDSIPERWLKPLLNKDRLYQAYGWIIDFLKTIDPEERRRNQ